VTETPLDIFAKTGHKIGGLEKVQDLRRALASIPRGQHRDYLKRVSESDKDAGAENLIAYAIGGLVAMELSMRAKEGSNGSTNGH
jgi:hypothetical protein